MSSKTELEKAYETIAKAERKALVNGREVLESAAKDLRKQLDGLPVETAPTTHAVQTLTASLARVEAELAQYDSSLSLYPENEGEPRPA